MCRHGPGSGRKRPGWASPGGPSGPSPPGIATAGGRGRAHPFRVGRADPGRTYAPPMLILALILFGMVVGGAAQLILGREDGKVDWPLAFAAGLIGSFVGGLLISLLAGDGIRLRPSGIIGSIVGALIVTAGWRWWRQRAATN